MKNFRYIDIHTHVNLAAFKDDWREVCDRALEAGVALMNVGTQQDTAKRAVEIARAYESGVYAVVGLHPVHTSQSYHDAQEFTDVEKGFTSRGEVFDASYYRGFVKDPKLVAIGECGLDYYRVSEGRGNSEAISMSERTKGASSAYVRLEEDSRELQEKAFIEQIELANEIGKPLMLHVRSGETANAYRDAHALIKQYAKVLGNVHFFAGTYEEAKLFWDIGYTTSFTGVITFARNYDEVIKNAPLEMLHAETDAPYVTPVPHRGKRNEPLYVVEVVKKIAEIRGEDEEKVTTTLRENARRMFGV